METESSAAPPVVAVVVVHDPGAWFDEVLDAFAAQDYPNLRLLFLDTASAADDGGNDVSRRVAARLPGAFVRPASDTRGFGAAANEVLRLVEGDNGFFLICHDDVAPDPGAVRLMVEELYRSNAGAVGPKLVEWDDPQVLQSVGLGMDRFGEIDVGIEPGERDQEQHDGVRDVFVLPSACLLIRADLFRAIGGFDPAISFHREDVELCWRIHHSGARVLVAPSARVRHRAALAERRPDLRHQTLVARHRMRAVATLTGASRLPGRSLELVLLTLAELVVGLFSGRFGEAWASARAFVGLLPRTPALLARRGVVKPLRRVPEREVIGLQERGSTRLNHFLRTRETRTFVGVETSVRRWRESAAAPVIAWIAVLVLLVVGSRSLITGGIPPVGEFLPFPESGRGLLRSYTNGFSPLGIGTTAANPTGWATLALGSLVTLGQMGLWQTLFTLGLIVVGLAGMSRLAAVFPSTRARVGALLIYAASPLVGGAMSIGSMNTLVVYASTPWILHLLRRAAGVETADPGAAQLDLPDGIVELGTAERVRRTIGAGIVVALAAAFTPFVVVNTLIIAVVLAIATLLALASWRTALGYLGAGVGAAAVGVLLNVPWWSTWTWNALVGAPPIGDPGRGMLDVAAFEIGTTDFAYLALALYLPVIAAILLARAWRLTWAVRAAMLVLSFGALAVLADRGDLPVQGPEAGVLLVPVAVGLAIAGGAALAAFDLDVLGGSFGWRQPLGLLASAAVVVGLVPGAIAVADGAWNMPDTPLASLLDRRFTDTADGRFNVLLLGDARVLPVPSTEYRTGVSWAITGDGSLDATDRWAAPETDVGSAVTSVLDEVASGSTQRAGQLLAPLGIRYIVIPEFDGVASTTDDPLPLPEGIVEAFDDQLDVVSVPGLPTLELFENRAWMSSVSQLTGATAEASRQDGAGDLVRADLSDATPIFADVSPTVAATDTVEPGVVHLAVPYDPQWRLSVDGESLESRPSFGLMTAFDVPSGGEGELRYETSGQRTLLVLLQTALWLLLLFAAMRLSVPLARRTRAVTSDETLIRLDDEADLLPSEEPSPGTLRDPGLDATGELARPVVADEPVASGEETGP